MIDTVVLSVPKSQVTSIDLTGSGIPNWNLHSRSRSFEKYVKNPSVKDKKSGYFPRLTGIKRKVAGQPCNEILKIEFSVPKILYENNLDELSDSQFSEVVTILHQQMYRMGVIVTESNLAEASVTTVHYSKNIELTDGFTSQYVICELNKININKRFDLARARFINDGQSLYAHAKSHSFVVYDKVADLNRGELRSIDRDQTIYQKSLFSDLSKGNQAQEIIRFEIRICDKRKLNSLAKKLEFPENPTFKQAFCTETSQKVVRYYWDTMIDTDSAMLFSHSCSHKDLLRHILIASPNSKSKDTLYRAALMLLVKEGNGMRELRSILGKHGNDRTWYRIAADARETAKLLADLKPRSWHKQIEKAITEYSPLKLDVNKSKV